jgi:hypothetical protein
VLLPRQKQKLVASTHRRLSSSTLSRAHADAHACRLSQGQEQKKEREAQNLLRGDFGNLSFVGSPDCVLPDASGKFFARFQFQWRIQF